MIIAITESDRFLFESAVDAQGIRSIINSVNSRLIYFNTYNLGLSNLGSGLLDPIPMGNGRAFNLPYQVVRFEGLGASVVAESIPEGIQVKISSDNAVLASTLVMHFDNYLTLRRFSINFGLSTSHIADRCALMNTAFHYLPTVLGYIVHTGSRPRTDFTLADPRQYESRGGTEESTQWLGDIRSVTNPRENLTGIAKRSHERAGYYRKNADGSMSWVRPTIVHPDDYEPDGRPKKPKF